MVPNEIKHVTYEGNAISSDESIVPKIIGEDTEKREEYIKHFINDDYSYEAVVYPEPEHYLEDGEWKEVNNILTEAK